VTPGTLALLHSPLVGAASWGALPLVLEGLGLRVIVADVTEDDEPPYATRYVARAAMQIGERGGGHFVALTDPEGLAHDVTTLMAAL